MTFTPFIQKIGTGPRGSKDLSRDEARQAMEMILSGSVHPVEFGAFCMALRVKGEANEELIGAIQALNAVCDGVDWPTDNLVTVASPFDGKDRLMPITPAATLLAAQLGARVLVLSDRDVPPKRGVTSSLVFEALGLPVAASFQEASDSLHKKGWACLEVGRAVPGLGKLKEWRGLLGKRPFISTAEKMINPAGSPFITGVFHGPVFRQMEAVSNGLGYPKTLVLQGTQGSVDVKIAGRTNVCLIEGGRPAEKFLIDPSEHDLRSESEPEMKPATVESAADWTKAVIARENPEGEKAVVLEAGAFLFMAGVSKSIGEGVEKVKGAQTF